MDDTQRAALKEALDGYAAALAKAVA